MAAGKGSILGKLLIRACLARIAVLFNHLKERVQGKQQQHNASSAQATNSEDPHPQLKIFFDSTQVAGKTCKARKNVICQDARAAAQVCHCHRERHQLGCSADALAAAAGAQCLEAFWDSD